jgi:hypothetical protein
MEKRANSIENNKKKLEQKSMKLRTENQKPANNTCFKKKRIHSWINKGDHGKSPLNNEYTL